MAELPSAKLSKKTAELQNLCKMPILYKFISLQIWKT